MRVLFDTNVILDFMLDRRPFSIAAAQVLVAVEENAVQGYLCATTVTTLHYLARKVLGSDQARVEIKKVMALFEIAPVNRAVLDKALSATVFNDFEDAVLYEAACHVGADAIVSCDLHGFKRAKLPIYSPDALFALLSTLL